MVKKSLFLRMVNTQQIKNGKYTTEFDGYTLN